MAADEEKMELLKVSRNSAGSTSELPGSGWGGDQTGKTEIFEKFPRERGGCEKFGRQVRMC